jgi:hypothetical protein
VSRIESEVTRIGSGSDGSGSTAGSASLRSVAGGSAGSSM